MKNLAGNLKCDDYIRNELTRARVPIVKVKKSPVSEVPFTLIGRIGSDPVFTFLRAWRYWTVSGPVPIEIAEKLYADPVGKTDVRAGGRADCCPPENVVDYYLNSIQLIHDPNGEEKRLLETFVKKGILPQNQLDQYRFVPNVKTAASKIVVNTYHIDSEVGLRLFVDSIRNLSEMP